MGQLIRHIELSTRYYYYFAFGPGFDMSFDEYKAEMKKLISVEKAMEGLDTMYDEAIAMLEEATPEKLAADLPENPMVEKGQRYTVIFRNSDHTAHHRGALAVYLRMLGITPKMIYAGSE